MSQEHPARFQMLIAETKTRISEITTQAALIQQAEGAIVIDVREAEEFAQQHIKGAHHLSRGLLEQHIETLAADVTTPIICYCRGGNRSALAADNLQKMGYTNVVSLAGGFTAWTAENLPISTKP